MLKLLIIFEMYSGNVDNALLIAGGQIMDPHHPQIDAYVNVIISNKPTE